MSAYNELRLVETPDAVRFEVHARPRAKRNALGGVRAGALEVSIAAPPVDGEANRELLSYLAKVLGVAKRDLELLRGEGSRAKLVEVRRIEAGVIRARLEGASEER